MEVVDYGGGLESSTICDFFADRQSSDHRQALAIHRWTYCTGNSTLACPPAARFCSANLKVVILIETCVQSTYTCLQSTYARATTSCTITLEAYTCPTPQLAAVYLRNARDTFARAACTHPISSLVLWQALVQLLTKDYLKVTLTLATTS